MISVLIRQEFESGFSRSVEVSTGEEKMSCVDVQDELGLVAGEAIRAILSPQNTGAPDLFWLGLFQRLAYSDSGGEWVRRLRDHVRTWWRDHASDEDGPSFAEYMASVIRGVGE